jgi:hypothetical protein
MSEQQIFHGPFLVEVTHVDSAREQRLVVSGSDASDGFYPAVVGQSVRASGDTWRLDLEWDAFVVGFAFSLVQQSVAFDVDAGLVFTLRALNGAPTFPIPPFDDLVVTVTSTDPDLNPLHPHAPPPDFSLPESAAAQPRRAGY